MQGGAGNALKTIQHLQWWQRSRPPQAGRKPEAFTADTAGAINMRGS